MISLETYHKNYIFFSILFPNCTLWIASLPTSSKVTHIILNYSVRYFKISLPLPSPTLPTGLYLKAALCPVSPLWVSRWAISSHLYSHLVSFIKNVLKEHLDCQLRRAREHSRVSQASPRALSNCFSSRWRLDGVWYQQKIKIKFSVPNTQNERGNQPRQGTELFFRMSEFL